MICHIRLQNKPIDRHIIYQNQFSGLTVTDKKNGHKYGVKYNPLGLCRSRVKTKNHIRLKRKMNKFTENNRWNVI